MNSRNAPSSAERSMLETLSRYVGKPVHPDIVCVAADPRQKGAAYWLAHREEYDRLSRVGELRHLMDALMAEAKRKLIIRAGFDVLREARGESLIRIHRAVRVIEEQDQSYREQQTRNFRGDRRTRKGFAPSVGRTDERI